MNRVGSRTIMSACAALVLLMGFRAAAQETVANPPDGSVAIEKLIAAVAEKTGKKFLVDPRVRSHVLLIGEDAASIDYTGLLSVLSVHGYAAVEDGRYVRVIPDAAVRQSPLPLVTGKETHADATYVGKVIAVKSVPAAQLVPLLRPLLPQQAHLVALPCTNTLMIADTFGNVKRIEKLVQALDSGAPYKPLSCERRAEVAKPSP